MHGRGVCAGLTLKSAALIKTNPTEWNILARRLAELAGLRAFLEAHYTKKPPDLLLIEWATSLLSLPFAAFLCLSLRFDGGFSACRSLTKLLRQNPKGGRTATGPARSSSPPQKLS